MSFESLLGAKASEEEIVTFTVDKQTLNFTAKEISYNERLHLIRLEQAEAEWFTHLVRYSIYDKDGRRMSLDQARRLSPEHMNELIGAAFKVNFPPVEDAEQAEKN